jgi:broad specificity phosphatase PhoE
MQRLLLIRHGESEWNRDGIIQGVQDSALSDLGREQSAQLRKRLDLEKIDVVYSSTATRAMDTARIALGHRLDIEARSKLCEINLGEWEGVEASALKRRLPEETAMWFRQPSRVRIKGGETLRAFRSRTTREIELIRGQHQDVGIVIVTHGGVICTYLTSLLGLKLDDMWRFKILNASITRVIFPMGRPRIDALNDVGHLDGAGR